MSEKENIATMTAAELSAYIDQTEERQRRLLKTLRSLMRAREAEEAMKGGTDEGA